MHFAQTGDQLFQGMQIIAHTASVTDLALAPFFGDCRGDRAFVDIQTNIEFSFHSVCLTHASAFALRAAQLGGLSRSTRLLVRLHVDESERFPA
jgi:hypothetical protein